MAAGRSSRDRPGPPRAAPGLGSGSPGRPG